MPWIREFSSDGENYFNTDKNLKIKINGNKIFMDYAADDDNYKQKWEELRKIGESLKLFHPEKEFKPALSFFPYTSCDFSAFWKQGSKNLQVILYRPRDKDEAEEFIKQLSPATTNNQILLDALFLTAHTPMEAATSEFLFNNFSDFISSKNEILNFIKESVCKGLDYDNDARLFVYRIFCGKILHKLGFLREAITVLDESIFLNSDVAIDVAAIEFSPYFYSSELREQIKQQEEKEPSPFKPLQDFPLYKMAKEMAALIGEDQYKQTRDIKDLEKAFGHACQARNQKLAKKYYQILSGDDHELESNFTVASIDLAIEFARQQRELRSQLIATKVPKLGIFSPRPVEVIEPPAPKHANEPKFAQMKS